jgi:hypothetical protein
MCPFSRLLIFEEMAFEYTVQHRGPSPQREISYYCNIASPSYMLSLYFSTVIVGVAFREFALAVGVSCNCTDQVA